MHQETPPNPKKTRYSAEELEKFKAIILKKLEKTRQEVEELKSNIQDDSSSENTFLDDGSSIVEQQEQLNELFARQYKFMKHLEAALERIKVGTYGLCKVTGELIEASRLEVVPHTQHSLKGKLMRKNKKY